MYQSSEKKLEQHKEEWKHPQETEDADRTLLGMGIAYGTMKATTHISKFINELVDETLVKEQPKKQKKYMDFKMGKNTNGDEIKEISVDEIPEEDKKEILLALAQAFGFAPEQEEEDD